MELAVSIGGTDSQHLSSHDHLHIDSQDFSLHQLAQDSSPTRDPLQQRASSPRSGTTSVAGTMSSSNVAPAPNSQTPTPPFPRRVSSNNNIQNINEIDIEGQNHDRMETDEESSEGYSSEADTPLDGSTPTGAGPPDTGVYNEEPMDTAPDRSEGGEVTVAENSANQERPTHILVDTSDSQRLDVTENAVPNAPAPGDPPPPPLDSESSHNGIPSNVDVDATAAGSDSDDGSAEGRRESPRSNENTRADGQGTTAGGNDGNLVAGENTSLDEPPPDGNRNESSSDEEEQPYWAKFEEDKSVPTEEELKLIEEQDDEINALHHDHWEKIAFEPLDDPEYLPTATGRISWTLKGFHGTPASPNREMFMRSPPVLIGGYYWSIKAYPRGNDGSSLMSVYIDCSPSPDNDDKDSEGPESGQSQGVSHSNKAAPLSAQALTNGAPASDVLMPSGPATIEIADKAGAEMAQPGIKNGTEGKSRWEVPAQILCVAYNPDEPRVNAFERGDHRFNHKSTDWGWRRFCGPWKILHLRASNQRQAMLRNDTLAFTAYIRTVKDDTAALWWHAPDGEQEWDHFERLGLCRMVSKDGLSAAVSALSTWLHIFPFSPSLKRLQEAHEKDRLNRPLFDDLLFCQKELVSQSPGGEHEVDIHHSCELISWYDAVEYEPDVVAVWDILRRALSYEASQLKSMAEARDVFNDILMLRQPDAGKQVAAFDDQLRASENSKEPCNVQEAIDLALTYEKTEERVWKTFDGGHHSLKGPPSVLQVELRRQRYDTKARKWKKSAHRVGLNETITFAPQALDSSHEYSLFGLVVHSGGLESKDYYSIMQPEGPGTRWIKYSGDKAERGVECVTAKQAIKAHEGSDTADPNSAVAYVVTYVRSDLFPKPPEVGNGKSTSATIASTHSEMKQDFTSEPMDEDDEGAPVPVCVYQSPLFEGHNNLGVLDWANVADNDPRISVLVIHDNSTIAALVDAVIDTLKAKFPNSEEKYGIWFVNTFMNNPAMENVLRAPDVVPMDAFTSNELIRTANVYYDVMRVWIHIIPGEIGVQKDHSRVGKIEGISPQPNSDVEQSMQIEEAEQHSDSPPAPLTQFTQSSGIEQPSVEPGGLPSTIDHLTMIPDVDTPMEGNAGASASAIHLSNSTANEQNPTVQAADQTARADSILDQVTIVGDADIPMEGNTEPQSSASQAVDSFQNEQAQMDPSESHTSTNQAAAARDGDTPMEGSAEVATVDPPPPPKPAWNPRLDIDFLNNDENIYLFIKSFDPSVPGFRGVKALFVKAHDKVGEIVKRILSIPEYQAIDVWEERTTAHVTPVSTGSRFLDVSVRSGSILIAQRRPSPSELAALKESGKPATVPEYRDYLFCATDPTYLKPHLTASYFSTPYFSTSLAYGRPHGPGTSISLTGDAYTGNFTSGRKSGHGTMKYANGDTYTGSWADNEPEGEGEMVYARTGNVYTGGFKKRKRHGKGVMKFEVADEEQRLCQICYEEDMDALFYDCGHVAACEACARQVEDCPVCRRRVKGVVRIWLSA